MRRAAFLVAAGILLSRLAGLIRLRAFAHYFGLQSDAADAFNLAFRIPNVLQNLFGEGALSASFIPVYAGLLARGDQRSADRLAGAVGALLALAVALLVAAGVLAAPALAAILAPGFTGSKRDLTVALVRILFPGAGLLVLSAWCLGVLNSHRRFLLSYAAPVVWNAAMIATLVAFGPTGTLPRLAVLLAWGSVAGSALQLLIQLPAVRRVAPDVWPARGMPWDRVRTVVGNFLPALVSRGVVQISAFIDTVIASLLPTGAVTALANAQLLYTLPVSLFGISVAAAELPAMSGETAPDRIDALRARLDGGLRQIAFFVVPSAMAFLSLGDVVAAAILQTGRFGRDDALYVWGLLAGASLGLVASTFARLYSSTFYALGDTRTPLAFAAVRVLLAMTLGYLLAVPLTRSLGIPPLWGAAGITTAAAAGAWVELLLLRRRLHARIGRSGPTSGASRLWIAAAVGAGAAWVVRGVVPAFHPAVTAVVVLGPFGVAYLLSALALGVPEASAAVTTLRVLQPSKRS
jgi:putative peptidoglycan lipid II flippase